MVVTFCARGLGLEDNQCLLLDGPTTGSFPCIVMCCTGVACFCCTGVACFCFTTARNRGCKGYRGEIGCLMFVCLWAVPFLCMGESMRACMYARVSMLAMFLDMRVAYIDVYCLLGYMGLYICVHYTLRMILSACASEPYTSLIH